MQLSYVIEASTRAMGASLFRISFFYVFTLNRAISIIDQINLILYDIDNKKHDYAAITKLPWTVQNIPFRQQLFYISCFYLFLATNLLAKNTVKILNAFLQFLYRLIKSSNIQFINPAQCI